MSSTAAEAIAAQARDESPLWGSALRDVFDWQPVFSPLAPPQFELGLETVYEAYLVHYGTPRLFSPAGESERILLGDYLYAHGLVRVAAHEDVDAVADLAALISLCAQLRADGGAGDGEAWAATAALLGRSPLRESREPTVLDALARQAVDDDALDRAFALHAERVG